MLSTPSWILWLRQGDGADAVVVNGDALHPSVFRLFRLMHHDFLDKLANDFCVKALDIRALFMESAMSIVATNTVQVVHHNGFESAVVSPNWRTL